MEAPEKIYVHIKNDKILNTWNNVWVGVNDIEYIRTDAFIEKTEKYLKTQFIEDVSVLAGGIVHINFSTAIKNFVNYIKEDKS